VIKNLGQMGGINSPIIWFYPLNTLEILLVFEKLDKIYIKKLVILPQFLGKNRAVSYFKPKHAVNALFLKT